MFGKELVLTPAELCLHLKVGKTTAAIMRMRGDGPPYIRIAGRKIVYRSRDVEAWLASIPPNHSTSEYDTKGIGRKPKMVAGARG